MSRTRAIRRLAIVTAIPVTIFACAVVASPEYDPVIRPQDFVSTIDNPYLPFPPGRKLTYKSADGIERIEIEVTHQQKPILGVSTTVVHDQVFTNGVLSEDTFDWYAQHKDGTVWYFGEDTKTLDPQGNPISTEGSWEAGVAGAKPGIVMLGEPERGKAYRQEFAIGVAEDMAKVVSLNSSVTVPYGSFSDCVETVDFTPLDPGAREHKFYARGIGLVLETNKKERVELTDVKH